ncbi:hypothetical protein CA3LBN_004693 [Candidozyma haemuli]|uniref:Uncharacterized protein n=1 Tax=Candidozyma haemuli TaxID=45357 RepID=A0ABX8IB85_9ASCO|nr:hypothetical protein CA3LBN_004693 [[Candida] haemuloni]
MTPTKLALQLSKPVSMSPSDANHNITGIPCHAIPGTKVGNRLRSNVSKDSNNVLTFARLKVKKPFLFRHVLASRPHCDLQTIVTNENINLQGISEFEKMKKLQRQDHRKKTLLAKRLVEYWDCSFKDLNSQFVGARDQAFTLLSTPAAHWELVRSNHQYDFICLLNLLEYYRTYWRYLSYVFEAIKGGQTLNVPVTQCVLFKPWAETPNPRHTFDDEPDSPPLVPEVTTSLNTSDLPETIVIVPKNIGVVLELVPNKNVVGHIAVEYPQLKDIVPNEEYDEDSQLYSAVNFEALGRKFKAEQIPIYSFGENGSGFAIIIPHFMNPIAENKVASEIIKLGTTITSWIALAPSPLNNGTSLCRLDIASSVDAFKQVPTIKPPHYTTGIVAAVTSRLFQTRQLGNANVLVLNAEGHSGFEKVDADSVMDAAELIGGYLVGKQGKASYIKQLSAHVRKINSGLTSGMYL